MLSILVLHFQKLGTMASSREPENYNQGTSFEEINKSNMEIELARRDFLRSHLCCNNGRKKTAHSSSVKLLPKCQAD
ncbi:hypothetical protein AHAS_Ahas11G0309300 [Arachis hypogaea]